MDERRSNPRPEDVFKVRSFGLVAAERAVNQCKEDETLIFLTRSEYEDLVYQAHLTEMKRFRGKTIVIVSDTPPSMIKGRK